MTRGFSCTFMMIAALIALVAYPAIAQDSIANLVTSLGINDSTYVYSKLDQLKSQPDSAVGLLIGQLVPITDATRIPQAKFDVYRNDLHVIWCIRALRYLTGVSFEAPTQHKFSGRDKVRAYLLSDGQRLSFFAVRMAANVIYIAPVDVQKKVIKEWENWYRQNRGHIEVKANPDFNDWFF